MAAWCAIIAKCPGETCFFATPPGALELLRVDIAPWPLAFLSVTGTLVPAAMTAVLLAYPNTYKVLSLLH